VKLGLGTVQFGMPYGIARGGVPSQTEISAMLEDARDDGIDILDTAPAYGESERRLGVALAATPGFRVVTKTPAFAAPVFGAEHAVRLRETFVRSLDALGRERVYALLVHRADDVLGHGGERLVDALHEFQRDGRVEKIGVSVYSGDQLDRVLDVFQPDLVQLPLNVFDQRLLHSGHLAKLAERGIEVHARSVFLQGLLLMAPDAVPERMALAREHLAHYRAALSDLACTPLEAALGFLANIAGVACALVGVVSREQLAECVAAARRAVRTDFARFASDCRELIDPRCWPQAPQTLDRSAS
jgi:aryl-alcohol dehydrogenase-like predicted oxidoreductase